MELEDLRQSRSPPLASDPKPMPEPALPASDSASDSSAVTVDDASKDFSHRSPLMDQSTRWTDQQHSLYIRSLEASFVNELHRSMRLHRWSLKNSTDDSFKCRLQQNSHNLPKQSQALQDGCQKKINLERVAPMLESTADSHVLAGSQFELTSVDGGCNLREPNACKHGLLCDEEIHARGTSTFTDRPPRSLEKQEVTDQNFKDEEARSSCMPLVKRLKTAKADDGSSSDQVVSFGKLDIPDVFQLVAMQAQKIKDVNCYQNPQ